jgi:hypothetical protein
VVPGCDYESGTRRRLNSRPPLPMGAVQNEPILGREVLRSEQGSMPAVDEVRSPHRVLDKTKVAIQD